VLSCPGSSRSWLPYDEAILSIGSYGLFQLDRSALHVDVEHLAAGSGAALVEEHVLETSLPLKLGGRRDASRALLDALRDFIR